MNLLPVACAALLLALPVMGETSMCDIAPLPAATLLLPYFEVDFISPPELARTTIFTIVNTSPQPQIARVTLWTDRGYPVVVFNLFLTGYDVQPINLRDVLRTNGFIAEPSGTSSAAPVGNRSLANDANPHFLPSAASYCSQGLLPGRIPAPVTEVIRSLLTGGSGNPSVPCPGAGSTHSRAAGYATVDVVATCSTTFPTDPHYYDELLFDNVLTGDYQQIDPANGTAVGYPLVHIRAVPEGGPAGSMTTTPLPYTFYDRLTPLGRRGVDRRQPLPSSFAVRWLGDGQQLHTELSIWREPATSGNAPCTALASNALVPLADIVSFDQHENSHRYFDGGVNGPGPFLNPPVGTASRMPIATILPPVDSTDGGGWAWINLDNHAFSRPSQGWMTVLMTAGTLTAASDATPLASACAPAAAPPSP
jgi:hypothetical protein